jgi:signal transduction histidine kinase
LIQANENRLVTKIGKDLSRIHTDKMKVRQILLNLLSNAAKFTQNGRITLSADRTVPEGRKSAGDIDTVSITVRDEGIGMTQKQLAYAFDAFRQVDDSSTRRYGGTGLGLAISQRLAELLGGSITATSEPGKGSTFTLNLPIQYRDIQEHGTDLPRR